MAANVLLVNVRLERDNVMKHLRDINGESTIVNFPYSLRESEINSIVEVNIFEEQVTEAG